MPELPDVEVYVLHLRNRILGKTLDRVRVASPFLVRSFEPPLAGAAGKRVENVRRVGKRIVFDLESDWHIVLHLMIAGRLRWREPGAKIPGRIGLAAFDFADGTLVLTEASTQRRASLHVVRGEAAVAELDPGGIEPLTADLEAFGAALQREQHTLKRALTDPHIFSGIGNAYSDEILWRARLSPVRMTQAATPEEVAALHEATRATLRDWVERLTRETGDDFPEEVTAFRKEMAVHGRYKEPCPACGAPVQRIAYAQNEANYCARCQTGGRLLADRALSRLMRGDWPKTLEELERRKAASSVGASAPSAPGGHARAADRVKAGARRRTGR
jgi:formamidopyrimidine-DNA glycosylase